MQIDENEVGVRVMPDNKDDLSGLYIVDREKMSWNLNVAVSNTSNGWWAMKESPEI